MVSSRYASPMLAEFISRDKKYLHSDYQAIMRENIERVFKGQVIREDGSMFIKNKWDLRLGKRPDLVFRYRNGRLAVWELAANCVANSKLIDYYLSKLYDTTIQKLHVCAMAWSRPAFNLLKEHQGRFFTMQKFRGKEKLIEVM